MIITKTPFRISFAGGGSDIEEFYSKYPGAVLSATINRYMYISSHDFFDRKKIRVKYAQTETVRSPRLIRHPILREVLKKFKVNGAVEISSNGDVPSGTGLGSSSAFTVGLLHNMHIRSGDYVSREQLADEACNIEITRLKEPIGKQDQYACAFGGMNIIRFNPSGDVNVEPLHLPMKTYKRLQANLLMFFTGEQRSASEILKVQKKKMGGRDSIAILQEMVGLVRELRESLYAGDLKNFGKILDKGWQFKKLLAGNISNPALDKIYAKAVDNGAVGGKLLGAGGGGFLLFYCEPQDQDMLRKAMSSLREMQFKFENEGSKLIYAGDEYTGSGHGKAG